MVAESYNKNKTIPIFLLYKVGKVKINFDINLRVVSQFAQFIVLFSFISRCFITGKSNKI